MLACEDQDLGRDDLRPQRRPLVALSLVGAQAGTNVMSTTTCPAIARLDKRSVVADSRHA
jgi:hypothetical protein